MDAKKFFLEGENYVKWKTGEYTCIAARIPLPKNTGSCPRCGGTMGEDAEQGIAICISCGYTIYI